MTARSIPTAAVNLSTANALVEAAMAAAQREGFAAAVAVVDTTGVLRSLQRADGANPFPTEVAIRKAWTAATSGLATHIWNGFVADAPMAPMVHAGTIMPVAGGYPLLDDGILIGGIGVSGATPDRDRNVARAALITLGFAVPS
jgi:uncharacterized protein GlcG (DUF336 family)